MWVSALRGAICCQTFVSHCGLIILWLSGPVFTPSLFCAGIILGAMTWHRWPGRREGSWSANQRPVLRDIWPMRGRDPLQTNVSLEWRVDTAKGLQQDRVHYRIQMRGELKIRNVNMGLVTLIRYSWSIFSLKKVLRGWEIFCFSHRLLNCSNRHYAAAGLHPIAAKNPPEGKKFEFLFTTNP